MMPSKSNLIGKWFFNYWPDKSKSSIIDLMEDGCAVTSNGTWYQWAIKSNGHVTIYNEGYVEYDGLLNGDNITGLATSEYSGNEWTWNAHRHLEPIIESINKKDLPIGWWTLINDIDEVDNNVVEFHENGDFVSKNYPLGKWSLDSNGLTISTAGGFLKYNAKCVDGTISGKCRNRLGVEWTFSLEHTCIPILPSQLPISKEEVKTTVKDIHLQHTKKAESQRIINYLQENGIHYFYHFTAKKNLSSIIEQKGLFSWKYLLDNGIAIPDAGGDEWSRELDMNEGLEDYVRLSFCTDHPMKYRKRSSAPVLLKIDIEVATFTETLFSDMNAASPKHKHGKNFSDLKRVDMNAVKRTYVSRDDPDFHTHQAEVMVKTHLPIKYILNINEFK